MRAWGFPRNLGDPSSPSRKCEAVPAREETKRVGTGRRKSEHPDRTGEAGKPTREEPVEGGGCQDTELREGQMAETPSSEAVSTKLQRVAELARQAPEMVFTTLAHHIDVGFLYEA